MRRRLLCEWAFFAAPVFSSIAHAQEPKKWDEECDVVIVGAGGAGLAAAVSAGEEGAKVIVFEKEKSIGGNTIRSGGYFGVVCPERQKPLGIADSTEKHFRDIFDNGDQKADPELVRTLVDNGAETLAWLEKHGMKFRKEIVEIYGSHHPRCLQPFHPHGVGYIKVLSEAALKLGVSLHTGIAVGHLFTDKSGRVVGVQVKTAAGEKKTVKARKGVVLASGGFGANPKMLGQFAPRFADLTTDNSPGSTGEMLLEAQKAGADLRDMERVQCLPGVPKGGKVRVRFHSDVARFIFVDANGKRFTQEDLRRDVLTDKILDLPDKVCFAVIDDDGFRSFDMLHRREAIRGIETGDAFRGDTLEELAKRAGMNPENLKNSVEEYNASLIRDGIRPPKRYPIQKPPFWMCRSGMTVHYTLGGIRINKNAECLRKDGSVIPGLYAAGEATGGVHGTNRIGGNGTFDAIGFGRIAGRSAAKAKNN